ncbi:LOW QUALITY PROTEIN: hypothetical protein PHMEG_00010303 [Phytophthora megakarya]|uniref:ZSWIM1/3 RNaseH-like domain-containing protein n=1 Tax=Phytophthora megakarya TaxID=4795 RepID=A0A225WE04_9STRA|nr:LOW QUALITY PROTEIN: hypothetical protein PHMEG_00010303 [Phytophthora megakarya]
MVLESGGDMRDSGSNVKRQTTLKDVLNMFQGIRKERRGDIPHSKGAEPVLREFTGKSGGNSAVIYGTQVASIVVFQSARMKRWFQAFPGVVLVDTTHNTSANKYKLFRFAVTEYFGKGHYVMHEIVKVETKNNPRCAIEVFKSNNPCWRKIHVLGTGKVFQEKVVLGEQFPEARELLCMCHVIALLEKQAVRLSSGSLEHKKKLKAALSTLVMSTSKTPYEQGKQYLLKLLGGDKTHALYNDFIKN